MNDTTPQYWQNKYSELPNELGPIDGKEVDRDWMQQKGLRYGGQDGFGDFWISGNGNTYHILARHEEVAIHIPGF